MWLGYLNGIVLIWVLGQLSLRFYHTSAPKTAVRWEYHHMQIFQADNCLRLFFITWVWSVLIVVCNTLLGPLEHLENCRYTNGPRNTWTMQQPLHLNAATSLLSRIQRCTVILNNVAALELSLFLDEIPRPMPASLSAISIIKGNPRSEKEGREEKIRGQ